MSILQDMEIARLRAKVDALQALAANAIDEWEGCIWHHPQDVIDQEKVKIAAAREALRLTEETPT